MRSLESHNPLCLRMLRMLLEKGADPEVRDMTENAALHYLCRNGPATGVDLAIAMVCEEFHGPGFGLRNSEGESCFELLLDSADLISETNDSDSSPDSAEYKSSAITREEMLVRWQRAVKFAVDHMTVPELERPLSTGKPPLTFAVGEGDKYLVQLLLEKGVDVDITESKSDQTALDLACNEGCEAEIA